VSMEMRALKQILAIKGLELPENVEAENPVSEFIRDQIKERLPDNEILTIAQDLFVYRANTEPLEILQALQLFNHAIVNFSMNPETRAYIKELTGEPVPDLPDGGAGREI